MRQKDVQSGHHMPTLWLSKQNTEQINQRPVQGQKVNSCLFAVVLVLGHYWCAQILCWQIWHGDFDDRADRHFCRHVHHMHMGVG